MTPIILIYPASSHLRRILTLVISASLFFSALACAKRSRSVATNGSALSSSQNNSTLRPVNLNTAPAKELETLPGIGKGLAQRIIEHRQKYGPFTKAEHVIMVRGISEHRFLAMRGQITVE